MIKFSPDLRFKLKQSSYPSQEPMIILAASPYRCGFLYPLQIMSHCLKYLPVLDIFNR